MELTESKRVGGEYVGTECSQQQLHTDFGLVGSAFTCTQLYDALTRFYVMRTRSKFSIVHQLQLLL